MENKSLTAVEWFFDNLKDHQIQAEHFSLYQQAKAMEKEHRFKDFRAGQDSMEEGGKDFEQYYNETYPK